MWHFTPPAANFETPFGEAWRPAGKSDELRGAINNFGRAQKLGEGDSAASTRASYARSSGATAAMAELAGGGSGGGSSGRSDMRDQAESAAKRGIARIPCLFNYEIVGPCIYKLVGLVTRRRGRPAPAYSHRWKPLKSQERPFDLRR
jgi:hypothetical protein